MTSNTYIVCPDGHFSEGDTCTTCGYHPNMYDLVKVCEHEEEVCECLTKKE